VGVVCFALFEVPTQQWAAYPLSSKMNEIIYKMKMPVANQEKI
jgi:hypothetical protein